MSVGQKVERNSEIVFEMMTGIDDSDDNGYDKMLVASK